MMIAIALITIAIVLTILAVAVEKHYPYSIISCPLFVIGMIIALIAVPVTIETTLNYLSYDANCYEVQVARVMLEDELQKYDAMRPEDASASPMYLEVRKKAIEFNANVKYATEHNSIWLNYLITMPEYTTVDMIPLSVG